LWQYPFYLVVCVFERGHVNYIIIIKFKDQPVRIFVPLTLHDFQNSALIRTKVDALSPKQYLQESCHCKYSVKVASKQILSKYDYAGSAAKNVGVDV
jgi:hypothetical protein